MRSLRSFAACLTLVLVGGTARAESPVTLDRLEFPVGLMLGLGSGDERYSGWGGASAGVGGVFAISRGHRLGLVASYQYNEYRPGSSDVDLSYFDHPPAAHVPQAMLFWGYAFTYPSGTAHGPRIGVGASYTFDVDPDRALSDRAMYPTLYAQAGYHVAIALPRTAWSIVAEWMLRYGHSYFGERRPELMIESGFTFGPALRFR